jgi:nicotinamidase-related amidase
MQLKIIETAKRHIKCQNAQWHYVTIIRPTDEKSSINHYRDMMQKGINGQFMLFDLCDLEK